MVLVTVHDVEEAQKKSIFKLCHNTEFMPGWCTPYQLCNGCGACNNDLGSH